MTVDLAAEQEQRSSAQVRWAAVAASAGLAALIGLRHIGTKPLWRDEAISLSVATRPVARIIPILAHHDANAGLYYLLLHGWLRLGGAGPAWARGFSALCLTVTAGLAAWAGSRWRGWPVGAACGLLVATNPFLVYYGQETRPYALAACLGLVSTIALFRPSPRIYLVATVALLYADLFAVLFVAAMAAAVIVVRRSRSDPVPLVLVRCWAVIAAASAPVALIMLLGERGQISWLRRPRWIDLERTLTAMTSGWLGLALVAALGVLALASQRDRPLVAGLAGSSAVPAPLLFAVAQIAPCFIDRYLICSAIAMIGLAAAGLDELRRRAGTVVASIVLAGLVGLGTQRTAAMEAGPYKIDNGPAAVAFIESRASSGDAIGYAGGGLRIAMAASVPLGTGLPADVALAQGGETFRQHDLYAREVTSGVLAGRLGPVTRLWVVTDHNHPRFPEDGALAQLRAPVTEQFAATLAGSFGGIDVTLYVRTSH